MLATDRSRRLRGAAKRPRRRQTRGGAFAMTAAMLLATGCGTSGDARNVRATVGEFLHSYSHSSGARACLLLSPALRKQVAADQGAATCAGGIAKVKLTAAHQIRFVRVFATSALVQLDGDTMFLGLRAGHWRIDALGCRPVADREPYDCQEQA